jgi:hypothetical protein
MGYWKEVPYRGEPPDTTPKPPKKTRTPREKRRDNIITAFFLLIFLVFIFLVIFFDQDYPADQKWKIDLILTVITLTMVGFGLSIGAINNYIRNRNLKRVRQSAKEKLEESD